MNTSAKNDNFFKWACIFEGSLILVAIVLGWVAGISPFAEIYLTESAIAYGLIGTVPLLFILLALYQFQFDSVQEIHRILNDTLGPSLHRYHWTDLFVLAAIHSAALAHPALHRSPLPDSPFPRFPVFPVFR